MRHPGFFIAHNIFNKRTLVLLLIASSTWLLAGPDLLPSTNIQAQEDRLRNLREEYAKLEREGIKENFHRQLSFTILQEYLPPGTRMTSGYRSPARQLDLILRMARANGISAPATASIEDENSWRPPLMALRQKGYIVASPTHTPHATDEAVFDLSGADLNEIQAGCRLAEKAGMIKFRRIIFEAKNNAIHVEIESVSPKAFNVLGRRPPSTGPGTGPTTGSSEADQRRSMLQQLQDLHDREPDPIKKIDYDRSKRNLLDPVAEASEIDALDAEIEQHQKEAQQLAAVGPKGTLIAKLSTALREGRYDDAERVAEEYSKAFPNSPEAQQTLVRIKTHSLLMEAQDLLNQGECNQCERAGRLIDEALALSPHHQGVRLTKERIDECRKRCEGSSVVFVLLGTVVFFVFAGSLTGYYFLSRPNSWLSNRMSGPAEWVLEGVGGSCQGRIFPIQPGEITVGAQGRPDGPADIEISDAQSKISRRHCLIMHNGNQVYLMDESTNGTKVNGQEIHRGVPFRINPGDEISLADQAFLLLRQK